MATSAHSISRIRETVKMSFPRLVIPPKIKQVSRGERTAMNMMAIGIVLAVSGASAGILLSENPLSQYSQHLLSLIAGSFGLIVNIATFRADEELCPRKIARQALSSVFLAGLFAPVICRWLTILKPNIEVDVVLITAVAGVIGLCGSYVLRKYGQQVADILGRIGVSRIKAELGDDQE